MAARGYADLSVGHILAQAGVSRTTFYENFDNKRECVLIAHEEAFEQLAGELFRACAEESKWPEKVVAAIGAAIDFAVRAPEKAQLLLIDAVATEPDLVSRVLASNDFLIGLLRNGREHCTQAGTLPELTERAMIGAITSVIGTRLLSGQVDRLPGLAPQLAQLVLLPYVGVEEARRFAEGMNR